MVSRRAGLMVVFSSFILFCLAGIAECEDKVVHVMGWGGDYELKVTKVLGPVFKEETGYGLKYFSKASSAEMVAMVQAEKSTPSVDVVIGDEGPQTGAPDLWANIDRKELPNLQRMYSLALIPGSGRVRAFAAASGIIYQQEALEKSKVAPPRKWADLWESRFRGKVTMPAPTNVYGYSAFVAAARLQGGNEGNLEPGFAKMASLAKSLATVVTGNAQLTDVLSTGVAWTAVYSDSTAFRIHQKGLPIRFVYPEDGAYFVPLSIASVKGGPHPQGARLFMNFMLGATAQKVFSVNFGYGPLNRDVVLTGDAAAWTTYGPARVEKLISLDWNLMIQNLPKVVDRWNDMLSK
jgi:putative spermidine/putrescine transport system substrate-binding protein